MELSVSIVTYHSEGTLLKRLLNDLLAIQLDTHIFVVDNSAADALCDVCGSDRVTYIFNNKNLGYGAGHNTAIKRIIGISQYHLIINPDIYFEGGTIEKMHGFMKKDTSIGLSMPKILYPDGSVQYLCRLLPSPLDLLIRRINSQFLIEKLDNIHALKFTGYDIIMDVPYLSGCFMFIRNEVFKKVGLFDERFFMYMEDVDFSRRIHRFYRSVYFPEAVIYHVFKKDSYVHFVSCRHHIKSALLYFNKYGWFRDRERALVNRKALERLRK